MVHSGMHIADSVVFSYGMRIFGNDFYSPYVPFDSPDCGHSYRYFPVPFMWMYGVVGSIGRFIHLYEFLILGLANGAGAALYLLSMSAFFTRLQETSPILLSCSLHLEADSREWHIL